PFGPSAGALLADATGAGTPVRRVPTVHGAGEACQPEIGMKKRRRIESDAALVLSRRVAPRPRSGRRAGRGEGPAPGQRAGLVRYARSSTALALGVAWLLVFVPPLLFAPPPGLISRNQTSSAMIRMAMRMPTMKPIPVPSETGTGSTGPGWLGGGLTLT